MEPLEKIKLYLPTSPVNSPFANYARRFCHITDSAEEADFLMLPFQYEVIYDFSKGELDKYHISAECLHQIRQLSATLDELSVSCNKPLIVFFYRDPSHPLPFKNAVVFRTSGNRSHKNPCEFGLPAFIDDKPATAFSQPRKWQALPSVSFRGQAAPLRLKFTASSKLFINSLLATCKLKPLFRIYYLKGYLLRRKAVLSFLKQAKKFKTDFAINQKPKASGDAYVQDYMQSLADHNYFICASGHGNYSFRMYEVLRSGGIPVWIDTDLLLPCAEVVDWNLVGIRLTENEAGNAAQKVLDFHKKIDPVAFEALQSEMFRLWKQYFSLEGFNTYLYEVFLPKLKQEQCQKN
jgi:hypothetical protein